ncbi:MAG TPA: cytochrome c oxidase assembly protein [Burkholderiales bacterium]|jgi:cytochrome c oxidase assembly protein subunit 11
MQASVEDQAGNRDTLKKLLVIAALMFGFGFALVPFYKKICEVTGVNNLDGSAVPAANTQVDTTRDVEIVFDANARHLAWEFKPLQPGVKIHPGQLTTVMYQVTNTLDRPVTGQAIPSYAPRQAAAYFNKLECFCFTQQTLKAHETKNFPVVFVIDPKLDKSIGSITLSYTFFEVAGTGRAPS